MAANTEIIPLSEPVMVGDNEVTELTMRRSLVRDRLEAVRVAGPEASSAEVEITLFGLLCGVPFEDLENMPDGVHDLLFRTYSFLKGDLRRKVDTKTKIVKDSKKTKSTKTDKQTSTSEISEEQS